MTRHIGSRSIAASIIVIAAGLTLVVGPARGQDRPDDRTTFAEETQVITVEVPVQVLLKGEPVRGLTTESFRIYEGRKLRPLTGFDVVDLSTAAPGSAAKPPGEDAERPAALAVPPAGRRHFLLLFDLAFTEAHHLGRALEGARSLVREGLHPSDLVGVAFYDGRQGANLVLQFTPDRAQVERVLDAFEYLLEGKKGDRNPQGDEARRGDPLGLTVGGWNTALVDVGQAAGYETSDFAEELEATQNMGSGIGGFLANNLLHHSAAFMEQAYEEKRSARAAYLADNLGALAQALRGIEGSKHLVLFSQGWDSSLMRVRLGDSEVGTGGGSWLLRVMNDLVSELRRSGWVIHGADLGGIASTLDRGEAALAKASLFFLADETGGVLVENANELAAGLQDVLERTSVTYVLAFQVADLPMDGAFQPIRVELVDAPRGAQVVHRSGYHAPRPQSERHPLERLTRTAVSLMAGEKSGNLPAELRATVLGYDGDTARVAVLVEVPGHHLLEDRRSGDVPAELYVYSFDGEGAVADFVASVVTLDSADREPGNELSGVKLAASLDLAPGSYEIRALVRAGSGLEAVRTTSLAVPSPAAGPSLLPPLFVQDPSEHWLVQSLSADRRAGQGPDETYPFVVEGRRIAPAAAPILPPGETVRLLLPGFGFAAEGLELDTRIVDERGNPVPPGPTRVRILGRRAPEAGQPDLLVAELSPEGLAPGDYRLTISLSGTDHSVTAPFRVRG